MSRPSNASRPAQTKTASAPIADAPKSAEFRQRATRIPYNRDSSADVSESTLSGIDADAPFFQTMDPDEIFHSIEVAESLTEISLEEVSQEEVSQEEVSLEEVSLEEVSLEEVSQEEVSQESRLACPRPQFSAKSASPTAPLFSAREELAQLSESLRQEFRNSVAELQATQTAAATAQSEVLRTLTEVVFQCAGSRDISPESLERAFAGVEDRLVARIQAVAAPPTSASPACAESKPTSAMSSAASPVKLKNAADSVSRSWEQIRSEFMENGDISESPPAPGNTSSETLHDVTQLSSDRHFRLPEQDPALEVPKAVDPESLSETELRDALRERDTFISTLIARIRRQQETATGQLSSDQLRTLVKELPDELATQVRHTLKQMDDLARLGELELSLERARIARQVNELEHSRQILLRNARQLGWDLHPDGTVSPPATQSGLTGSSSSSRRWLGKLGFGQ